MMVFTSVFVKYLRPIEDLQVSFQRNYRVILQIDFFVYHVLDGFVINHTLMDVDRMAVISREWYRCVLVVYQNN